MTKKNKLSDMMASRSPLLREAVEPANLYTKPQVDKTISPQTDKPTKPQSVKQDNSRQVVKTTKPQVVKSTSIQNHKTTKPLVDKYTTHLRAETIKEIKRRALESDKKDYEVVQEAINRFFKE
jgi:hypothetical protein